MSAMASSCFGSSVSCQRGGILALSRLDCAGRSSFSFSESLCECHHFMPQLNRAESSLHGLQSPIVQSSSPRSHPQHRLDAFRCFASQLSSSNVGSSPIFDDRGKYVFRSSYLSRFGGVGCEKDGNIANRSKNCQTEVFCKAGGGSGVGSSEWMFKATPYEVLGVPVDSSEEEVKSAFRARIKEYHPDVYQGLGDADAITQRLLRAYELLTGNNVERNVFRTRSLDPFEDPECFAEDIFVNELDCIGRGCPYSCVERAPDVFQFAPDTGRARAGNQDNSTWKGEYHVQLAVGQCPQNCIHHVTPEQRLRLDEILTSVLEGTVYSGEAAVMDGLIARAKFENGRYQPPKKRKAKKSEQWVDWY